MSDVYYIIGGVAYGILQFIISWVAGISKVDAEAVKQEAILKAEAKANATQMQLEAVK